MYYAGLGSDSPMPLFIVLTKPHLGYHTFKVIKKKKGAGRCCSNDEQDDKEMLKQLGMPNLER